MNDTKQINVHIWVASHVHHEYRLKSLKVAVTSIANQTINPIVHISFSVSDPKIYDPATIKKELEEILKNNKDSHVYIQNTRKRQFEHIKYIYDKVVSNNCNQTWISFLDDDDIIAPNRIESILHNIKGTADNVYFQSKYYEIPNVEYIEVKSWEAGVLLAKNIRYKNDHGTRIVHLNMLKSFFNDSEIKKVYASDKVSSIFDLRFTNYIDKNELRIIGDPTYLKNNSVPRSWDTDLHGFF